MEQSKTAVKGKRNKTAKTEKAKAKTVIKTNGLILTLDDSIGKYANDPFFIEHARIVNERFKSNKSDF